MKTYDVLAQCKTPECAGMLRFGVTTADSPTSLNEQLHNFLAKEATCSVCQQTAIYTFRDYLATPLE
jgi:hypothetical protein